MSVRWAGKNPAAEVYKARSVISRPTQNAGRRGAKRSVHLSSSDAGPMEIDMQEQSHQCNMVKFRCQDELLLALPFERLV